MTQSLQSLHAATLAAVLRGPGETSAELRGAVARGEPPAELAALVEKIQRHAYRVTEEDFAALRAKYSEDQLFEIIVAASVGAADLRLAAGLGALERA